MCCTCHLRTDTCVAFSGQVWRASRMLALWCVCFGVMGCWSLACSARFSGKWSLWFSLTYSLMLSWCAPSWCTRCRIVRTGTRAWCSERGSLRSTPSWSSSMWRIQNKRGGAHSAKVFFQTWRRQTVKERIIRKTREQPLGWKNWKVWMYVSENRISTWANGWIYGRETIFLEETQ